jgi:hypothetical protein
MAARIGQNEAKVEKIPDEARVELRVQSKRSWRWNPSGQQETD